MSRSGASVVDGTLRAYYFQLRLSVEEYGFRTSTPAATATRWPEPHHQGGSILDRRPPVNRGNYATERPARASSRRHAVAIQQAITNAHSSSLRIRSPASGQPPASVTLDRPRVDVPVKKRRVSVAIVVHEHELLPELVHEIAQIAARPLLDHRRRRRVTAGQTQKLVPAHAAKR